MKSRYFHCSLPRCNLAGAQGSYAPCWGCSAWSSNPHQDVSLFVMFLSKSLFKETKTNSLLRFCEILKERGTTLGLGNFQSFHKSHNHLPAGKFFSPKNCFHGTQNRPFGARFKGLCHRGVFQRFRGQKSHTLHDGHGASWKVWAFFPLGTSGRCFPFRERNTPVFPHKQTGRGRLVEPRNFWHKIQQNLERFVDDFDIFVVLSCYFLGHPRTP